jgi:hypothetical protein
MKVSNRNDTESFDLWSRASAGHVKPMSKDGGRDSKISPVEGTSILETLICFVEPKCAVVDDDATRDCGGGGRVDGGATLEGIEVVGGSTMVGTKTSSPSRNACPRKTSIY